MSYSVSELKLAAYNWTTLPDMTPREQALWQGLGYCYEWYRSHPEDKAETEKLAQEYINFFGSERK